MVALDTHVTESLKQEGWIRDLLRKCQVLRKEAGLNVEDRIHLKLRTEVPVLQTAIQAFENLIKEETLAENLVLELSTALDASSLELEPGKIEIEVDQVMNH